MQSRYEAEFSRDMACSAAEWLSRLPLACEPNAVVLGTDAAVVDFSTGRLLLTWSPLPDRVIALLRMPRLWVRFQFEGLADDDRQAFMKRFDLTMQRGGG